MCRKNTVFFEGLKDSLFKSALETIASQDDPDVYQSKMDNTLGNLTMIHVYFGDLGITLYSREELYGIVDVIGGFVCLFVCLFRKEPLFKKRVWAGSSL